MDPSKSSNSTHQRLFEQQTVNSLARRSNNAKPVDSLDLSLSSVYNHETDLFHSKHRIVLQMANSAVNPIKQRLYEELKERQRKSLHHPLIIGEFAKLVILVEMTRVGIIFTEKDKIALNSLYKYFLSRWYNRSEVPT